MPFEKKINVPGGIIGIRSLIESSEILLAQHKLSETDQQRFDKLKIERRKKEFLTTRILLKNILGENQIIEYHSSGKPKLKDSKKNISISHSADFAAIYISNKKIGIDIEQTSRNIDKVATRFLHPKEKEFISDLKDQQKAKILFWSAKEAIFKCSDFQGIQFSEQIIIEPFNMELKGTFNGSLLLVEKNVKFKLHYLFLENNVMVYCVEQKEM
jgi:phosphopantetheinyl transferase